MRQSGRGRVAALQGLLLLLLVRADALEKWKSVEEDTADMAEFLVFLAPAAWNSVLYIAHTQNASVSSITKMGKAIEKENITELKNLMKSKNLREALLEHLDKLAKERDPSTPAKNRLFSMDTTEQAANMQKDAIEKAQNRIKTYSASSFVILKEYISALSGLSAKDQNGIWVKYKEVVNQTQRAMKGTESVKRKISALEREFSLHIQQLLTKRETPRQDFLIERARFNLGGFLHSPGIFLQISQAFSENGKRDFLKKTVEGLLQPVFALQSLTKTLPPEQVKAEVLRFLEAASGEISSHVLKEKIEKAYQLRSESISMYTELFPQSKERTLKIDEVQTKNTKRMVEALKKAKPEMFKGFFVINKKVAALYTDLVLKSGVSEKNKREIKKLLQVS